MIRKEAISFIANQIGNQPIISANGYISRDLFSACHKSTNFYMMGSMGLASSIGLGVALKKKTTRVFVFDGDGNILMNLGSLVTIGSLRPKNLVHVIFDNSIHESTGGQPTNSNKVKIEKIAKSTNYRVFNAKSKAELNLILKKIEKIRDLILIVVKINKSTQTSGRITLEPEYIRNQFSNSLNEFHS